jgi:Nicotinic acid phosphoribosyltransferase
MFNTTNDDDIKEGKATDAYFLRTEDALDQADANPEVVADVSADQFGNGAFEVLSGVNDATKLLSEASDDISVWTLPEGTLFDGGPVMRIKGSYKDFARYETSLLGFLSHASGIATNAFEVIREAKQFDVTVLSFGSRHVNPKIAPVVERGSLVAGFDGISHVSAADLLGREPSGTIPHAVVLSMQSQEDAWRAFNESAPEGTPRIVIADTFTDEADEAIRAADELGDDLDGVRLDTTGSRRGDFRHIIKEVRWKLDEHGRGDVDIFVSGGLGPSDVRELGDIVDGFGIGGYVSNADPVDFSLDIVDIEGESVTKRGKLPGIKSVRREENQHVVETADNCDTGLFELAVENGDVVQQYSIEQSNKNLYNDAAYLEQIDQL